MRHTRHNAENGHDGRANEQGRGVSQLRHGLLGHGLRGRHACDDDCSGQRQEQRRDLRDEPVANRQQGLCLLCHSAPIPEERFQGNLAPSLVTLVQGKSELELRQSIEDPSIRRPGTIMPAYFRIDHLRQVAKNQQGKTLLSSEQIDDVVAYLMTLRQP